MFSGPLLPLPPDFPLQRLVTLVHSKRPVGVWLRESGRQHRLSITASGRCISVLISEDLGALLRSCSQVLVREGSDPRLLQADALIRWRALQVVTATPYLLCPERLKQIFPGSHPDADGFHVPIGCHVPEEVLSDCLTHDIPVAGSRIVYQVPCTPPRPAALAVPDTLQTLSPQKCEDHTCLGEVASGTGLSPGG
jgi:hypothetical protein